MEAEKVDGTEKPDFAGLMSNLPKAKSCFSELLRIGKLRREQADLIREMYLERCTEALGANVESRVFGAYFSVIAYLQTVLMNNKIQTYKRQILYY